MVKTKKEKRNGFVDAAITGANYETVQRYGSAAKEHLVAYSGVDNERIANSHLQKSLESINQQGTNAEYAFSIRQQKAGWAAEVKDTANVNAENIIAGKVNRKIRHDDLPDTPANHPLYDHVEIDADGNVIAGSGTQMKFIGGAQSDPTGAGNAERALKKLQSKEFQKYIDHDVKIEVPKDEYQQMINRASEEIDVLQKQLETVRKNGNAQAAANIEKKISNLKKLKKNLKPSTLTRKEALEAVDSPMLSTVKSVAKVSHSAGMQAAGVSAAIGGSVSIIRNVVSCCKDEIEVEEAAKNIVGDTAKSAAVGYGTVSVGTAIKASMQNSSSAYVRALSKTNLAGTIVSATLSASKILKSYFIGEIDGTQCLENLGEQGTGMIASSVFAAIGHIALPKLVIGGLIGGMVGYALASASYSILVSSLKEAKMARQERIAIEKACEEHIQMIREYRTQVKELIDNYLTEEMQSFEDSFSRIKDALVIGDVDLMIEGANDITQALGGNKPFETMDDFNTKMLTGETFKI